MLADRTADGFSRSYGACHAEALHQPKMRQVSQRVAIQLQTATRPFDGR